MKIFNQKNQYGFYFIGAVIFIYIITAFLDFGLILKSLSFALHIFIKVIPVFMLVFVLMIGLNFFITKERIKTYLEKSSGFTKYLLAIIFGILSVGPIYMWYPALKELYNKGVNYDLIAVFLYNKAIKPVLFPVFIYYFGLKYVLILSFLIIIFSLIQGIIFNNFFRI